MSPTQELEAQLMRQLADLQVSYQRAAAPILHMLAELKRLQPPPPVVMTRREYDDLFSRSLWTENADGSPRRDITP